MFLTQGFGVFISLISAVSARPSEHGKDLVPWASAR